MSFADNQILPCRDGGRGGGRAHFLLFGRGRVIFFAVCLNSKKNNTRKAKTTKHTRKHTNKHSYPGDRKGFADLKGTMGVP